MSEVEEELVEQGVPALTRMLGALQIEAELSQHLESFDSDCSEEDSEQLSLSQPVGNDGANHSSETNSHVVIGDQESIGDVEDNHDMGSDEVQQPTKQEFIDEIYDWPDKELDVKPQKPNASKDRNRKKAGDSAKRKRGDLTDTDSDAPCCSLVKFQRTEDSMMQVRAKSNLKEVNTIRKGKACQRCRNQSVPPTLKILLEVAQIARGTFGRSGRSATESFVLNPGSPRSSSTVAVVSTSLVGGKMSACMTSKAALVMDAVLSTSP